MSEQFFPDDLLIDTLRARCIGRLIKVGGQRKFRRCVDVSGDGDLGYEDGDFAIRYTFAPDITHDAAVYDKVTIEDEAAPPRTQEEE